MGICGSTPGAPEAEAKQTINPMSANVQLIGSIFQAWGEGKYSGEKADELIAEHITTDWEGDATTGDVTMKNTDMYKVYNGYAGFKNWIARLTDIDFPDFEVVSMVDGEEGSNTVLVTVRYTPTVKASMRSTLKKLTDTHVWTVEDGKVSKTSFTWEDAAALDALFLPMSDNVKIVGAVFGAWGAGKYMGDGADAAITEHCAADWVGDATTGDVTMKNTDMYKVYNGCAGWKEWIIRLAEIDFPDFKPLYMNDGADNTVSVKVQYTPTVKVTKKTGSLMTDTHVWTVKDGKISNINFTWGDAAGIDALFLAAK